MTLNIGMVKKGFFLELLSLEATSCRPSEEVIKKIQSLSGLLDVKSVSPNWRNGTDKKVETYLSKKPYRNDSFQSLPSLSSPINKSKSNENFNGKGSPQQFTKYVSKFKNSDNQVKDTILNTIILSKLNKFSESTYNDIRDFLCQILGSSNTVSGVEKEKIEDFVKEFMNLVFKKAASEEIFCPLYAKLLGEISVEFPIILDEMNKLHKNYLMIFDECDENQSKDYDAFVENNKEKKYRQGYSQFLSELASIGVLQSDKLVATYTKILDQILIQGKQDNKLVIMDEYIDCLLRITKVLRHRQETFFVDIRTILLDRLNLIINEIHNDKVAFKSLSNKSRFLIMNIQDYLNGK